MFAGVPGFKNIDAALNLGGGKAYFFKGNKYIRYDIALDRADYGYPYLLNDSNWPGVGNHFPKIDAAINWGNGKAYLFCGNKYIKYDIAADKADPGYPREINKSNWPGLGNHFSNIDAAINWGNGKAYFFSGGKFIRYDIAADRADDGYPANFNNTNWPGLGGTFKSIDAAIEWGNGKAYFFKGEKYIRYDIAADKADPGYPLPINENTWYASLPPSFPDIDESKKGGDTNNRDSEPRNWIYEMGRNWMSLVPGETLLRRMSIPGTHDSGAKYGGAAYQCQSWEISVQLKAGIRFLDIRLRREDHGMNIYHGSVYQQQSFGDVLTAAQNFLSKYPNECIVMRTTNNEHSATKKAPSFEELWKAYETEYPNLFYNSYNVNPTLNEVRGRIYVMSDVFIRNPNGTDYPGNMDIQDLYKVYALANNKTDFKTDYATLPGKKSEINNYIKKAYDARNDDKPIWFLNYLSGSTGMAPVDVARATNESAYKYIKEEATEKYPMGIVIMDFPGEKLLYRIMRSNFF